MTQEEFDERLSNQGTALWEACQLTLESLNQDLVSINLQNITENLKNYIDITKDELIGRFDKISALSASLGFTEKDLIKINSMRNEVEKIGVKYSSIDEYVIDACTLTDINEKLREVL